MKSISAKAICSGVMGAGALCLVAACSDASGEATDQTFRASVAQAAVVDKVTPETTLAAVLVRADWCSSCKIIEPKLHVVRAGAPIKGVSHLTLDYTDRDEAGFLAAADEAGIGPAIRNEISENGVTTGIILLVDVAKQSVVGDLRKSHSIDDLAMAMEEAAAA
ncbi:MAG: hypothetical protein AAF742_04785 [Pseudomonadota bacterium]